MILALILSVAPLQDEVSALILQLESDSLTVREEAARKLIALGPDVVGRLEKARDAAKYPEVRARLESIIAHIAKMAELSKVFGPTRRITVASKGRLLKEVMAEFRAPFVSALDFGKLDEESRLDVQVRDVTWWEGLDRVVHAAGARYEVEEEDDGRVRIKLIKGQVRPWPVVYANQFRITVAEALRIDGRALGERENSALLFVELRYQPDLKPKRGWSEEAIQVKSVLDAKGASVKEGRPEWAEYLPNLCGSNQSYLAEVWIKPSAALPLTVTGTTNVAFPCRTRTVELELEGDKRKARAGPTTLEVVDADWLKDESHVKLSAQAPGIADMADRLSDSGIAVIDSEGKRHPGRIHSMRQQGDDSDPAEWELVFTGGIANPRKLTLQWIEEFHRVEIPFRLEGVRLPDLK